MSSPTRYKLEKKHKREKHMEQQKDKYVLDEHWQHFDCAKCGQTEYCKQIPKNRLCFSCRDRE
jgi:acetyl-CoA carboxylase beta subunit